MSNILSQAQIEQFGRDGFIVVRQLFDAAEMAAIRAWVDDLQARPDRPGREMKYYEASLLSPDERVLQRIENFYPYHEDFKSLFDSAKLKGATEELFRADATLYKDKINFKLPGGDGFKPHQDQQAGWNDYATLFITALVTIDRCTEENGCLELVAGHHNRGLIGKEWAPLSDAEMAGMTFKPYPTEPGDAVFFDSYAPHGSGPNLTETPRRVLYVTYNRASEGDHRAQYFADKRKNFPPDCEREPGREYVFRV